MAKRSKKKNPNLLTQKQKEDILFNQNLDLKKKGWDIRLNITLGIAIGIFLLAFLVLPAFNMNFSSTLSELVGSSEISAEDDASLGVTINMSLLSFLTAGASGSKDALEYLANHADGGIEPTVIYEAFKKKVSAQDVKTLGDAYMLLLIISIVLLVSWIIFLSAVCVKRRRGEDGAFLLVATVFFAVMSIVQWIVFLAVGIAGADKGQLQPHIASYLIMACGISVIAVYGVYRAKIKKLKSERRETPAVEGTKQYDMS